MSVWPEVLQLPFGLSTGQGELVNLRIAVEPRLLEDLLDTLAQLPFPVNPQIHHQPTSVEFPAYESALSDVRRQLDRAGFPRRSVEVQPMILALRGN